MGIGIFGTLHIAKEGLFTQQSSIGVTSHNIANVNTPGYSRQKPVIETMPSQRLGGIYFGRGAHLASIIKSYNKFLNKNIILEKSILGRWETKEPYLSHAELIFNEPSENGLNAMLCDFWQAWQDLANHPEGTSERAMLQSMGQSLGATFKNMISELERIRSDANNEIASVVNTINQLTEEIADLNSQIIGTMTQSSNQNDLTDQRSLRIEELSKLIDINVIEEGDGHITILTNSGRPLVSENLSWPLKVEAELERDNLYAIKYLGGEGEIDITDKIAEGSLKGLLEIRDEIIPGYMDKFEVLAASLIIEVNRIHSQGYGLDGTSGNYFFNPANLTVTANRENEGNGEIYDADINDPEQLIVSDFDIQFISISPATSKYDVYDTRNEEYVYYIDAGNSVIVFDDSGAAGVDSIASLTHGTYTGSELAGEIEKQLEIQSYDNQNYTVTYNENQRAFTITNNDVETLTIKWDDANTNATGILGFEGTSIISSNSTVSSSNLTGTYNYAGNLFEISTGVNDEIDFDDGSGPLTATLGAGVYTGEEIAVEIETQLEAAGGATFSVSYNRSDNTLTIGVDSSPGPGDVDLLWSTSNSATLLGYDAVDTMNIAVGGSDTSDNEAGIYRYFERIFDISNSNNALVYDDGGVGDGTGGGYVTATLSEGRYTGEALAAEIERQLETTLGSSGQNYIVQFDVQDGTFTIINASGNLHSIDLDWTSSTSAAVLGYDPNITTVAVYPNVNSSAISDNSVGRFVEYKKIDLYGMSAKISDGETAPQMGDIFSMSTIKDAAQIFSMDPITASDTDKIAAAQNIIYIDGLNNTIVFDDDGDGDLSTNYRVTIPVGEYTPDGLAAEIEMQLEQNGSGQSYSVNYDRSSNRFNITSHPTNLNDLILLWENIETTAEFTLGFRDKIFNIPSGNNVIQFVENGTSLTATLTPGYYLGEEVAEMVQSQLRAAGTEDYSVTYDNSTRYFTITNPIDAQGALVIQWSADAVLSNALGFDAIDETAAAGFSMTSDFTINPVGAGASAISDFETGGVEVGDNRNALEMGELKNTPVLIKNTLTLDAYYGIIVSEVGIDVEETNRGLSHQEFMIEQFEERRQSIAGVSLDEEMINLIKYQQAFTANTKLISTLDGMLDTIIEMKR